VSFGASPPEALSLLGKTFSLSHRFIESGPFLVTVSVSDGEAAGVGTATVTVLNHVQAIDEAIRMVTQLENSGKVNRIHSALLQLNLALARKSVIAGRERAAAVLLGVMVHGLDGLVRARRISAADAAPLRAWTVRIIASIEGND